MKRIQYKLLVILLIAALVPMLIIELISLRTAKQTQKKDLLNSLESISQQKHKMIDHLFAQEKSHIQILSNMPQTVQSIEALAAAFNQGTGSDNYQRAVSNLAPLFNSTIKLRSIHNVYVIASNGDIIYSNQPKADFGENLFSNTYNQSNFSQSIKQTFAKTSTEHSKFEAYIGDSNTFSSFISTPITNGTSTIAALVFQVTPDKLNIIAQDYTALDNSGETVFARLENNKAIVIAPLRFDADAANKVSISLNNDSALPIRESVQGVSGQGESIDYRGTPTLASWRYLPDYNIGMVVKIDQQEAFWEVEQRESIVYLIALILAIPCLLFSYFVSRRFTQPIINIVESTNAISKGNLDQQIKVAGKDEIGQLASSINEMSAHINRAFKEEESNRWLQRGIEQLSQTMRGNQISTDLSDNIVAFVSNYLNAKVGSLYIVKEQALELAGGFAFVPHLSNQVIAFGEGLIGQTAITKHYIEVSDVPQEYTSISSSLGQIAPKNILIYPILKEDIVIAVIELGWISEAHPQSLVFLDAISESVGTALGVADSHNQLQVLLDHSQQQMEELQVREEELRAINEEVEQRSKQLAQSQKELERQSDELKVTNEALEQKTLSLESQNAAIEAKNIEIEYSKQELEKKAEQLEASSKYKSEFLANMSHELRTPLNSMLILSRILSDNDEGNLDQDQIESAQVINSSGKQLLMLINDILDLSKIEAGKMETNFESFNLTSIIKELNSQFQPLASEKGIELLQKIDDKVTLEQSFDVQKTQQILKNLLSNAVKFTESGSVTLDVKMAPTNQVFINNQLNGIPVMSISVIDTGIGITAEKSKAIFEAFQQADGSTSRKYGGTGLGLTISRHLTELIGGELSVQSKAEQGSVFTLHLPLRVDSLEKTSAAEQLEKSDDTTTADTKLNDVPKLTSNDSILVERTSNDNNLIIIIEDDESFAQILSKLAKKSGFNSFYANSGKKGLEYVRRHQPCGVILDLGLPDIEGSELLAQLKADERTKDIPVHIISGDTRAEELTRIGAQGYHQKPVGRQELNTLFASFISASVSSDHQQVIIFDDSTANAHLDLSFLNHTQVDTIGVHSFDELSHNLGNSEEPIKGIIIKSQSLSDECSTWLDQNYQFTQQANISIVLFVDDKPNSHQEVQLEKYDCHVILDGPHSEERLHDEVALFLSQFHQGDKLLGLPISLPQELLPSDAEKAALKETQTTGETSLDSSISVKGCNVLLVDDDLRNTFALSKVLKKQGMVVTLADNGQMALDKLHADDKIDIVLMDIMMPVMDGYEAMTHIRDQAEYANLPIIALTAKAMQEDRRKCVEAGASDYLTKPVDVDKLVAMMKVWLYKEAIQA